MLQLDTVLQAGVFAYRRPPALPLAMIKMMVLVLTRRRLVLTMSVVRKLLDGASLLLAGQTPRTVLDWR